MRYLLFDVDTGVGGESPSLGQNWWRRPDGAVITARSSTRTDPDTGVEEDIGIDSRTAASTREPAVPQPGTMTIDERARAEQLVAAEEKAEILFAEVTRRGLVAAGEREAQVSARVRDLGVELFGTRRHWHKRIVRSGPNTLQPYREDPPDRTIEADDIVFLDFGPIFAEWEADLGRTYVLGGDPVKHRLRDDLPRIWAAGRAYFEAEPAITGAQLYRHVVGLAEAAGWEFGGHHSGHLVGEFPHETIDGEQIESYIAPANTTVMRGTDRLGRACHWILEVHLVDRSRQIGGFHEQLLTLR